jgi:ferredoxin
MKARFRRPLMMMFTLLLLLLTTGTAMAWDDCPKNKTVCNQPCRDYIDTNQNGICDHVEPAPAAAGKTVAMTATTSTQIAVTPAAATTAASTGSVTSQSSGTAAASTTAKTADSGAVNSSSTEVTASLDVADISAAGDEDVSAVDNDPSPGENLVTALQQPSFLVTVMLLVAALLTVRRQLPAWGRLGVLGVSLVGLGFYLQGCMCPVGVLANLPLRLVGVLQGRYMLWLLLFLVPIIFLWWGGRVFCSGVCPIGAVQEFIFRLGRRLGLNQGRPGLEKYSWLRYGKYLSLLAVLVVTPIAGTAWWCDIDPFGYLFNRSGSLTALILLIMVLATSLFISRFWCRFLCPYGALLGILNKDLGLIRQGLGLGLVSPAIAEQSCKKCGKCARNCPVDAISSSCIDTAECINCGECLRQCKLKAVLTGEAAPRTPRPALGSMKESYEKG